MEMQSLRQHVVNLLTGKGAHADFETAIKDLPAAARGQRPKGAEHSPWEVLEHLRIAQSDILEFRMALWLLAKVPGSRNRCGVGPERRGVPPRPQADVRTGQLRRYGPVCEDSARRRSNHSARSSPRRRPQRLSHWRTGSAAAPSGRVALKPQCRCGSRSTLPRNLL